MSIESDNVNNVNNNVNNNNNKHDGIRTKFAVLIGKLIEKQKWLSKPVLIQHIPIYCDGSGRRSSIGGSGSGIGLLHRFDQCSSVSVTRTGNDKDSNSDSNIGSSVHHSVVHSQLLSMYLTDHHNTADSGLHTSSSTTGSGFESISVPKYLIRDVYVVDFQAVTNTVDRYTTNTNTARSTTGSNIGLERGLDDLSLPTVDTIDMVDSLDALDVLLGSGLLITYSGMNGQVPNMDLLSMVKTFDSKITLSPSVSWMELEVYIKGWIRDLAGSSSNNMGSGGNMGSSRHSGRGGARRDRSNITTESNSNSNTGSNTNTRVRGRGNTRELRATSQPPNLLLELLTTHLLTPLGRECAQLVLSVDPSLEGVHRLIGLLSVSMIDISPLWSTSSSSTSSSGSSSTSGTSGGDTCTNGGMDGIDGSCSNTNTQPQPQPVSMPVTDGLGLHGQYIAYNIDAITLKTYTTTDITNPQSHSQSQSGSKNIHNQYSNSNSNKYNNNNMDSNVVTLSTVLVLVLGILRGSSNLYGK